MSVQKQLDAGQIVSNWQWPNHFQNEFQVMRLHKTVQSMQMGNDVKSETKQKTNVMITLANPELIWHQQLTFGQILNKTEENVSNMVTAKTCSMMTMTTLCEHLLWLCDIAFANASETDHRH